MKSSREILILAGTLILVCAGLTAGSADQVMVVINESSIDSIEIGEYYVSRREIPENNICRIRATEQGTVSRQLFEKEILRPVAQCLSARNLQDQILYIVTTDGTPLVVEGDDAPLGDLASVDSELTQVYRYLVYGEWPSIGKIENSYFTIELDKDEYRPFRRSQHETYLVTRLSGPTVASARQLVDRALEKSSGGQFYFDLPSEQSSVISNWLDGAADDLKNAGHRVTLETTAQALHDLSDAAGYVSFGTSDPTLSEQVPQVGWREGAIAVLFDPKSGKLFSAENSNRNPAALFVEQGITGLAAYVAEPTSDGYLRPQVLFPAYTAGHNLAESFYLSTRYLSWRQVVIGDPLASPYSDKITGTKKNREIIELDSETNLPVEFQKRRRQFLIQKYATSEEAASFLLKAEASFSRENLAEARRWVEASLQRDPFVPLSHELKAQLFEAEGDLKSAFDHYKKALELGLSSGDIYTRIAHLALEEMGDAEAAEPYARWLFRREGFENPEAVKLWARVLKETDRLDEAEAVYHRMVTETDPAPAIGFAALGEIYLEKRDFELARSFLEKAAQRLAENESLEAGLASEEQLLRATVEKSLQAIQSGEANTLAERQASEEVVEAASVEDYLTRPAQIARRFPPDYPSHAVRKGIEGFVVLSLLIDEMGQLMEVEPIHGDRSLTKAATKAVWAWQFEPRLVRGRPEVSRLTVTIDFKIDREE